MAEAAAIRIRGRLIGQDEPVDLSVAGGRVISIDAAGLDPVELGDRDAVIAPPLFDIQVNGAYGINLQGQEVSTEDVRALSRRLAAHGVSHWIPTLITGSYEDMAHGCRVLAEALDDPDLGEAVPGIHLEGPYISPVDGPRGAHPKAHVRAPDFDEFRRWHDAAKGGIAYVTVAPEAEGAVEFIRRVSGMGIVVSLGHHDADAAAIAAAVDAGATLCTHLGNGVASTIHRHRNPIWPQLADDRLKASLIADLEHLPPPVLKSMVRAKGTDNVVLTSDCVHITGLPPGHYTLCGHDVELTPHGRINLSGTDLLAGSALMLLQGVINTAQTAEISLEEAHACASTVPAALFGLQNRFAAPTVGSSANFIVFDVDRSATRWKSTLRGAFIRGERVERQ